MAALRPRRRKDFGEVALQHRIHGKMAEGGDFI